MHRVLVLGAGTIRALISGLLGESGDYRCYDHGGNHQISARLVATGEAGHQRAAGE